MSSENPRPWPQTLQVGASGVKYISLSRDKTAIVTELALADGNWSDLAKRVRCVDLSAPIVLVTSFSTAELWWDALECGVDDILPEHFVASRLCELLKTQGTTKKAFLNKDR
jgi:DNA-binding NarL/FixJ family response regulator